jgi:signal peptidase I
MSDEQVHSSREDALCGDDAIAAEYPSSASSLEYDNLPSQPASAASRPVAAPAATSGAHRGVVSILWNSIQSLAATVVIALFVITFIVQAFQIPSESMENTLLVGDYLLVDKIHFSPQGFWPHLLPYETVHRGEVVVFRYPVNPSQHFVKRVIAIPGDHVRLYNKRAWVNGKPVDESHSVFHSEYVDSYRDDFPAGDYPAHVDSRWWRQLQSLVKGGDLVVPPGDYFVLGDNRDESLDSRYWGFVPRKNIVGRPLIVYFSMESDHGLFPQAEAASDKLSRFAEAFTSAVREVRWGRTLHVVR